MDSVKTKELEEFFGRGVNKFVDPDDLFRKKLEDKILGKNSQELIVKFGIDPTMPDIHLGHAVAFRKLRQLQDWGCKIVFLVGDFTAQIGDPTGKNKTRPEVEQKEVEENLKTYLSQLKKILKTNPENFSWIRNSDWFTSITDLNLPPDYKVNLHIKHDGTEHNIKVPPNSFVGKAVVFEKTRMQINNLNLKNQVTVVTLKSFLWSLKKITHSCLIERDMFQERIRKGQELYMHEMMYPVFQGIDSQVLSQIYGSCDLEIGGSDQLFNMIVGRDIMKFNKKQPQSILSLDLLSGLDGKEKMSKSLGNYIGITEPASEMFGKVMSIPDTSIPEYFTLCTYSPLSDIKRKNTDLNKNKSNPRDLKLELAQEITAIYHGEKEAEKARNEFLEVFQKNKPPENLKKVEVKNGQMLVDVLMKEKIIKSKSEFKRLITEGAVSDVLKKIKINDPDFQIKEEAIFRIGKKRFLSVSVDY